MGFTFTAFDPSPAQTRGPAYETICAQLEANGLESFPRWHGSHHQATHDGVLYVFRGGGPDTRTLELVASLDSEDYHLPDLLHTPGRSFEIQRALPMRSLYDERSALTRIQREHAYAKLWIAVTRLQTVGVEHGDISLENTLYRDGAIKIVDWELANDGNAEPGSYDRYGLARDAIRLFLKPRVPLSDADTFNEDEVADVLERFGTKLGLPPLA